VYDRYKYALYTKVYFKRQENSKKGIHITDFQKNI